MARRVMIVDDAGYMRRMLKQMLEAGGYEVVAEACDGTQAVALYPQARPDVVTMDITMPDMDGITAVREILRLDPAARIVICSAMGQADKIKAAVLAGARHFLVKPLEAGKVLSTLKQVLGD